MREQNRARVDRAPRSALHHAHAGAITRLLALPRRTDRDDLHALGARADSRAHGGDGRVPADDDKD